MWKALSVVVTAATLTACTQAPATEPTMYVEDNLRGTWFNDDVDKVHLTWPSAGWCADSSWDCETGPTPAFWITSATCDGCKVMGVSPGLQEGATSFYVQATTTGPITLSVTVESGGVSRELQAHARGDREVAMGVVCEAIRSDQLAPNTVEILSSLIAPCGATHAADRSVVLVPQIVTEAGATYFPFCPTGARCSPDVPRKTSAITVSGANTVWNDFGFYQLTDATAAHQVTLSGPLVDGSMSTVTIATPALAAR
jgi:hypothetical protein